MAKPFRSYSFVGLPTAITVLERAMSGESDPDYLARKGATGQGLRGQQAVAAHRAISPPVNLSSPPM